MDSDNKTKAPKKIISIVIVNLMVLVFLLSLLWSSNKRIKLLEKENIELTTRLQESQSQCSFMIEERHYLYDVVTKVNDGLVTQTKSIINLTKILPKTYSIPVVRDTVHNTQHHGN